MKEALGPTYFGDDQSNLYIDGKHTGSRLLGRDKRDYAKYDGSQTGKPYRKQGQPDVSQGEIWQRGKLIR